MRTAILFILMAGCLSLQAQVNNNAAPPPRISVFVDCSGTSCDMNYIRNEIRIVDFVNDRTDADLHILITSKYFGYWNQNYQLIFYGQRKNAGFKDTLTFSVNREAPDAEKREKMVQLIKGALVPFLLKTPFINAFSIDMKSDPKGIAKRPTYDEWNYIVITLGGEGEYSADQNYKSARASGSVNINRTTDKSRVAAGAFMSKYKSVYLYEDATGTKRYEVNNRDQGIYQYSVLSLGRHFSIGYQARYSANSFMNLGKKFYINPVIELNLFPYADINTRSLILRYGADWSHFEYVDTTIYNKTKENLYGHEASLNINFNQKWGSFSTGAYYRNYFVDPELRSMGATMSFNIRIVAGLSFYVAANGNIVHDQVYLLKGNATEQEVLLRQRQLKSTFNYYTSGGLYYRFGSKLNNFVNPRVAGYRGF